MEKRIVSVLFLTFILTSTLSIVFIVRPSLAESSENNILDEHVVEKTAETTSPNKATEPDQVNELNTSLGSIFERKLNAKQDETLEHPYHALGEDNDTWSFNDANRWSNSTYVDGNKTRLIVGVNGEESTSFLELEEIAAKHHGEIVNTVSIGSEIKAIVVELLLSSVTAFVEEINSAGLASYVEPDMKVQAQFVPNDPYWSMQWGPQKIEADWAWNTTTGNSSILVAVIDTGVDYNHPDLTANYVPLGHDWVNNDTDPMDDNGHGTHCAGIIAAVLNNSVGITGLAQVRIMAEKGLDINGTGDTDDLANAIIHAVDQGADILSMSWGSYGRSELVYEALKCAYNTGVLLVGAAGNEAVSRKMYPAAYEQVIAVAATDELDDPAWFTNYGDWIELAAPGVDIYSTISEMHDPSFDYPYDYLSGTSMATPHVAGTAALAWSRYKNVTHNWIRFQMRCTADDLGEAGFDVRYGHGRINARSAVEQPPQEHDLIVLSLETPSYVEPGSTVAINTTIFNFGKDETNTTVQLLVNSDVVDSVFLDFLETSASTTVTCHWTPTSEGTYNVTSYIVPAPEETNVANNAEHEEIIVSSRVVALFKNFDPWLYPANQEALSLYSIPCAVLGSTMFGSVNLTKFLKVVIASDQDQGFYFALDAYRWWFDDYVFNGGVLEIHAADIGYNAAGAPFHLPGGLKWKHRLGDQVAIIDTTHPILTTPNTITAEELDGWCCSVHGYFAGILPADSQIILIDEHYGQPVCLEFSYGSGRIIASGLTLEWAYKWQYSRILENSLLYTISDYPAIIHDVAIVNVTSSQTSVCAGTVVNVTVVARNEGNATETFRVTAHYDNASIGTRTIFDLHGGSEAVVTFTWDTTGLKPCKEHVMWAEASVILGEVNTTNNIFVDGDVKIKMLGDINDDDRVDIFDVVLAAQAYGSKPGDPNWNPYVDLAPRYGIIDICDLVTITALYGTCLP